MTDPGGPRLHAVRTIGPDASLRRAALDLERWHVPCLVVVEGEEPVGLVTDRDVAMAALREGHDPDDTPVSTCMSSPVVTMSRDEGPDAASKLMRRHHIRKLPLVDGAGRLTGLVTADDLVLHLGGHIRVLAESVRREVQNEASPLDTGSWVYGKE